MLIKVKNRHTLRRKEVRELINKIRENYNHSFFEEKSNVETGEVEGYKLVFVENKPVFMFHEKQMVFTLNGINKFRPQEKFVVVDMGAVSFVTSGADVMAPGVVDADKGISEGDPVWVCDEKHKKPLAVGFALMNSEQMIKEEKGKAVKVVHYVGDRLWNLISKSL
ncbi:MAG: RNA-binding protein [Candidatus Thermoplasmatota archaeon]|jgi:PUA domain protein|nr:RNA-binding protein [Candidatus Thermoplasmatota archaeon]